MEGTIAEGDVMCGKVYHKGLGRFLGAFPSDTGIFTTGNGPGKSNGPFDFQYRDLRFIGLTLSLQKC